MGLAAQKRFRTIVSYTILGFWAFIFLFPMYWVVITSFKNAIDMSIKATYMPYIDFQPGLHACHLFSCSWNGSPGSSIRL